ncbi:hypothetical protein NM208_g7560 [Fusarium decemcellulare]|uniref:Uncharacterized protein n=1 Tax=Fusarium decemcellulare TaxID=57161 RepID=A0ACC1S8J8_9HYPO|nr:hypothetical protein NM208_g7560 [Fusarium decemcellulare]
MANSNPRDQRVAVIGLGAMGIVAVKNLLEEGFDVTGFERNSYIAGLWHFTEDEETLSVLESTIVNISTDRASSSLWDRCAGTPAFCPAKDVDDYLESYVDHFKLRPHLRLNTTVTYVAREDKPNKWRLDFEFVPSEYYEKVIIATGPHLEPMMPTIRGHGLFTGRILHSRAFKRPEAFDGKRVIVLGLGNTGSDVADTLIGHASSVFISHNHGALVFPRDINKATGSKGFTYRFSIIVGFLEKWCPSLSEILFNRRAKSIMNQAFGNADPSWRLSPAPSVKVANPVVSDTLINKLRTGEIRTVPGIQQIVGPKEVELTDGQVLDADAIICCTGYKYGFGILDPQVNPSAESPAAWLEAPGSKDRPLPRLYQNVFSLKEPSSLAFLGCAWFITSAFCLADLTSMCIAQVWAGHSKLPSQSEMNRWMNRQEQRISSLAQRGTVIPASVPTREWLVWADQTAGMGVEEHLGMGMEGVAILVEREEPLEDVNGWTTDGGGLEVI